MDTDQAFIWYRWKECIHWKKLTLLRCSSVRVLQLTMAETLRHWHVSCWTLTVACPAPAPRVSVICELSSPDSASLRTPSHVTTSSWYLWIVKRCSWAILRWESDNSMRKKLSGMYSWAILQNVNPLQMNLNVMWMVCKNGYTERRKENPVIYLLFPFYWIVLSHENFPRMSR